MGGGLMPRRLKLDNYVTPDAPRLGWRGWLRWVWRQVTSMRVALILLLLLGVAAIPGSVIPQRPRDPAAVLAFLADHPDGGRLLERLGFFDVFGSSWFTAIYLLLFASLIGCIVPRTIAHARALGDPPAAAPRALTRYQGRKDVRVSDGAAAIARVRSSLAPPGRRLAVTKLNGYRVRVDERRVKGREQIALAAESGRLREWGNLAFHVALVGILTCVALGAFLTYRGQAIVVEGRSFTNAVVSYDSFSSGSGFRAESLEPFTLTLDSFVAEFSATGSATDFRAEVTVEEPGRAPRNATIRVNSPLGVGGAKVYLQGNGYAPALTVRDSTGAVALSGPVPFLPQDAAYTSTGVLKVPDVTTGPQIGIRATLLPTAPSGIDSAVSLAPQPLIPVIVFSVWVGDLGLDGGVPQNVYVLDDSRLSPVRGSDGQLAVFVITPGETVELPDGLGSVTWDGLPRFAAFDLRADPTLPWLLGSAILALAGLAASLLAPHRRVWVVASTEDGTTVVTAAAVGPDQDEGLRAVVERAIAAASD
jgi:cytochrome c biogenesis protein